jgi:hypothetical protein
MSCDTQVIGKTLEYLSFLMIYFLDHHSPTHEKPGQQQPKPTRPCNPFPVLHPQVGHWRSAWVPVGFPASILSSQFKLPALGNGTESWRCWLLFSASV